MQKHIAPHIGIAPGKALVDEKVSILLSDFPLNQLVTVRAQMQDDRGKQFISFATFKTDGLGVVELSTQRPTNGTYDAVDSTGLFWSMAITGDGRPSFFTKNSLAPALITFTADLDGCVVASASLERLFVAPEIKRKPVREHGLIGTLFLPADSGPHRCVIVLGGSDGGLREPGPALLASHGYAKPSWTYRGEFLPFVPVPLFTSETIGIVYRFLAGKPISGTGTFLKALRDYQAKDAAAIAVERIRGPVLLISGRDDRVWPSTMFCEMVIQRLTEHNHPHPYRHLSYDGAGHLICFPYEFPYLPPMYPRGQHHPITGLKYEDGGTPKADAHAISDSWFQALGFLEESLGKAH